MDWGYLMCDLLTIFKMYFVIQAKWCVLLLQYPRDLWLLMDFWSTCFKFETTWSWSSLLASLCTNFPTNSDSYVIWLKLNEMLATHFGRHRHEEKLKVRQVLGHISNTRTWTFRTSDMDNCKYDRPSKSTILFNNIIEKYTVLYRSILVSHQMKTLIVLKNF